MAKPTLIDPIPYQQAGLIPPAKKGAPAEDETWRKSSVKKQLRILDEQTAITRYKWTNLPCMLSSTEVERLLYYKGQLCLFYMPSLKQWYFMPFALNGTIDFYGRYNEIHPVPMAYGEENKSEQFDAQNKILSTIILKPLYGLPTSSEQKEEWAQLLREGKACVIIHDYTRQVGFMNISRQVLNDPLLDIMSDCIPFMRTSLLANSGLKGLRVPNEMDYPNVLDANKAYTIAALTGNPYIPIVGNLDFQELTGNSATKAEEYMLAMQSLDNYRLSLYGLESGGLFQKKEHVLESEQEMNANNKSGAIVDGLMCRQHACDILNACLGLGIECEVREVKNDGIGAESESEETINVTENNPKEEGNNDE